MTIEEYFGDWCKVIDLQEADRILKKLSQSRQIICPQIKNIFRAFHLCPLSNLKVIILGQDPYSTLSPPITPIDTIGTIAPTNPTNPLPTATGISFANSSDTPFNSYSPSLAVLRDSVIDFTLQHRNPTFDPTLEKWEEQGVLMLNSALSCEAGKTGSHTLLWRPFMKSLLTNLSNYTSGIIYVLMGNSAQTLEPYISSKSNYIIKTKHPSWCARSQARMPSDIWRQINTILKGLYGAGVKWYEEQE